MLKAQPYLSVTDDSFIVDPACTVDNNKSLFSDIKENMMAHDFTCKNSASYINVLA